jgi:hypothetical protein
MKATTPMRAFWAIFTTTARSRASLPAMVPAATTAPVVSIVPPSQAPVTADAKCSSRATSGSSTSIGTATMRMRETVWLTFFGSPLSAPPAAMAADTPQTDTPVARIAPKSSSSPKRRASQ